MANCSKCGRDVGCGCNLIDSKCMSCYNEGLDHSAPQMAVTARKIYNLTLTEPTPQTEFEVILNTQGLSKDEKLKRINDIIQNSKTQI